MYTRRRDEEKIESQTHYLLNVLLLKLVITGSEADASRSGEKEHEQELEDAAHVDWNAPVRWSGTRGSRRREEAREDRVRRQRQRRRLFVHELDALLTTERVLSTHQRGGGGGGERQKANHHQTAHTSLDGIIANSSNSALSCSCSAFRRLLKAETRALPSASASPDSAGGKTLCTAFSISETETAWDYGL